jgi:uncharacterized protein (DUF1800 family)
VSPADLARVELDELAGRSGTRRHALQAIGLGAGALAMWHLLPRTQFAAASGTPAWSAPLHTPRGRSAHFLRRATWGYNHADLDRAAAMPYHELVDSVLGQAPQRPSYPDIESQVNRWKAVPVWFKHMATTSSPFPERMAFYWHGHLTSDADKCPGEFNYMALQMQLFRERGLGDLRTLLIETALSGAMMEYLDMQQSKVGAPNENFARELMELFTLGPGNYTEQDVREAARALTGYRMAAYDGAGREQVWPKWGPTSAAYRTTIASLISQGWTWRGKLNPKLHDNTNKTFLGQTGNWGLEDIIDIILSQPACARFVAAKLIQYFVGDTAAASGPLLDDAARAFRASGYDIRTLMRTIFLGADYLAHPDATRNSFLAADAYRSAIRGPVEYVQAAVRATGYTAIADNADWYIRNMGQQVWNPPNVSGWHQDSVWVGASSWLARMRFAGDLEWNGRASNPDPTVAIADQLDGVLSPATASTYGAAVASYHHWYTILGSPEFQLK